MKQIRIFSAVKRGTLLAALVLAMTLSTQANAQTPIQLDLADVVGGGDGTGTGTVGAGIESRSGNTVAACFFGFISGNFYNDYKPVPSSAYIDGVFIPSGSNAPPVTVSSTGLTVTGIGAAAITGFPNARTFDYILNRVAPSCENGTNVAADYYGIDFGQTTAIRFHANNGITFDLDAFEADNPGYEATEFEGLLAHTNDNGDGVQFAVVVDGVIVGGLVSIAAGTSQAVTVPLSDSARFLTFIVTDGGVTNFNAFFFDQIMIGNPTLTLSTGVADADNDGVPDGADNCPNDANPGQIDSDGDLIGDVCDDDRDGDAILNDDDNCPDTPNGSQDDFDGDGAGDACDDDADGDGVANTIDACLNTAANDLDAGVPSRLLGKNRWADTDGDGIFDTAGNNPTNRDFTIYDTAGCGCAQIIEACGYGEGHTMFGCSNSDMDWWTGRYDREGEDHYQCKPN